MRCSKNCRIWSGSGPPPCGCGDGLGEGEAEGELLDEDERVELDETLTRGISEPSACWITAELVFCNA